MLTSNPNARVHGEEERSKPTHRTLKKAEDEDVVDLSLLNAVRAVLCVGFGLAVLCSG